MDSSSRNFTVYVQHDPIAECASAFRTALDFFGSADLAEFLPERSHPRYLETLAELVRLELAQSWKLGHRTSLETYRECYPELFTDTRLALKLVQEEFKQRGQAGETPSESDYQHRFNLPSEQWPTFRIARQRVSSLDFEIISDSLSVTARHPECGPPAIRPDHDLDKTRRHTSQPRPTGEQKMPSEPEIFWLMDEVMSAMPEVGADFAGFYLLAELGKGAFGKVFLAEQEGLAGRKVALKVAAELLGESHTLAELQHAYIVPIYSFHPGQPFQAVCMPYLGSTTLADVLHDIRRNTKLPGSGKGLLSTLNERRKKSTQNPDGCLAGELARRDSDPTSDATPPAIPQTGVAHANLLALEGMSYVDAILWLAVRLADGLAHAHEKGIIHRDLKPANVLLTEEGLPMLLDFNLAQNPKLRGTAAAASIGGTLPYMAPEHLDAFRNHHQTLDPRSDLYSLGVILFELLTGTAPFPTYRKRAMPDVLGSMILDRRAGAPRMRHLNPAISPAVESIIRRCLEPDVARRYQTANELEEDLQRQLANLPLKHAVNPSLAERAAKFRRRHPLLGSAVSIVSAALALVLVVSCLFAASENERSRLQAQASLTRFGDDMQTTCFLLNARSAPNQLNEGERSARAALAHFHVLDHGDWRKSSAIRRLTAEDRDRLEEDVGQMLVLLAHAQQLAGEREHEPVRRKEKFAAGLQFCSLAMDCYRDDRSPRALWQQQGQLLKELGQPDKARECFERANQIEPRTPQDRFMSARQLAEEGKFRAAVPLIKEAIRLRPKDFNLHLMQGVCHDHLNEHAEAIACYRTCIALRPDFHGAYFNRGLTFLRQNDHQSALADFNQVARLAPDFKEVYPHRALAHEGLKDNAAALADLTAAMEKGADQTRVYFMRARIHRNVGDLVSAKQDFDEGLKREPTDELSWLARGNAYEATDPKRSLHDFDKALELNPRSLAALHNKAVVLAKHFKRNEEAVATLDRAVELYPDDARARTARGIYLARLGKRDAAHKDAELAMQMDRSPLTQYIAAGIFALTSKQLPDDQQESIRLLSAALRRGVGHEYLAIDRDLDPLRESPVFRRIIDASRAINVPKRS